MKRVKRTGALLLAVLLAALPACRGGEPDGGTGAGAIGNQTAAAENNSAAEETEPAETEQIRFTDTMEFSDFGGEDFTVYTTNSIAGIENSLTINVAEEQTGEAVNDALFSRDLFMAEKFNVNFKMDKRDGTGDAVSFLTKSINAGDDVYRMILQDQATVAKGLSLAGYAYPLNLVDGIRLNEPYWMPEVNAAGKIGDSTYFTGSAISPRYYGSAYITMFNRDMASDLGLESLYDLVNRGTWTFDKMAELSRAAAADTDGDGEIRGDGSDRVGIMSDCFEMPVLGADMHFIENRDGELRCCLEDEKLVNFMQKVAAFFTEPGIFSSGHPNIDMDKCIENGNTLFFVVCSFALDDYRSLEYDYGILPSPKYDENQAGYVEFSQPWVCMTPVIPVTATGDILSMAGTLTDAMAAYGYDYIRDAAFEKVICYKGTRDEESAKIIDLIFENITFELCSTMGFRQLYSVCQKYLCGLSNQEITSSYADIKQSVEKAIAKAVDTYAANEEKFR